MVGMIPWVAILKHAPAILAAADALRTRVRATNAGDSTRSVDARLAELEDESRASAQLTQDMAQQINALTLAHENSARTARRGLALGIAALVLAIAGVILAIAM
jgi:soluble lytic murein transglycosylase-like protein